VIAICAQLRRVGEVKTLMGEEFYEEDRSERRQQQKNVLRLLKN
jgi:hypothetical protein